MATRKITVNETCAVAVNAKLRLCFDDDTGTVKLEERPKNNVVFSATPVNFSRKFVRGIKYRGYGLSAKNSVKSSS